MIYDHMDDCFANLKRNILEGIENTDTESLFNELSKINEPTLVTGVGGSSVVATFLAKVLTEKNHIICNYASPRDLVYMDLSSYKNVISVSYSGNNVGVTVSFNNQLKHYLFTGNKKEGINCLLYNMNKEASYVSISATLVPISIIALYYCNNLELIESLIDEEIEISSNSSSYQVIFGYENKSAAMLLESSINESGMASCILHDKYNYCHGRLNTSRVLDSDLIFFNSDKEIDEMMLRQLPLHFKNIIKIDEEYDDPVINDYYDCIISMKTIHQIATEKHYDISDMKELEDNDFFYLFNGEM